MTNKLEYVLARGGPHRRQSWMDEEEKRGSLFQAAAWIFEPWRAGGLGGGLGRMGASVAGRDLTAVTCALLFRCHWLG